jgi:hypothetical protein
LSVLGSPVADGEALDVVSPDEQATVIRSITATTAVALGLVM